MPSADCSGPCAEGFFCPRGSSTARAQPCGGEEFFCPHGSPLPQAVQPNFYAVGGNSSTRAAQAECRVNRDSPTARGCPGNTIHTLSAAAALAQEAWVAATTP